MPPTCTTAALLAMLLVGLDEGPRAQDSSPTPTLELERTIVPTGGHTWSVAFSPNGATVCSGGDTGDVILWDAKTGTQRWHVWAGTKEVMPIAWRPAGDRVAVGANGRVVVLDARDGRELLRFPSGSMAIAWSPDGSLLAHQCDKVVRVVAAESADVVAEFDRLDHLVNNLAFSPTGSEVLAGMNDGNVFCLSLVDRSKTLVRCHRDPNNDHSCCIAVGWCGGQPWSLGYHGDARIGNDHIDVTESLLDHYLSTAIMAPDGESFAIGGRGFVRIWSERGRRERSIPFDGLCGALSLHPCGQSVAVATGDSVLLFDGDAEPRTLRGHVPWKNSIAWSADGSTLAIGGEGPATFVGADGTAMLVTGGSVWPGRSGDEILMLHDERLVARSGATGVERQSWPLERYESLLRFAPGSDTMLIRRPPMLGRAEGVVWLDLTTGERRDFAPSCYSLIDAAWAANGSFLVATNYAIAWSQGDRRTTILECVLPRAGTLAFAPDGSRFVCGAPDLREPRSTACLRLFDGTTLQPLRTLPCAPVWVRLLDGHTAVLHDGSTLSLWDLDRGLQTAWLWLPSASPNPPPPAVRALLADAKQPEIHAASLSPDRSRVAVVCRTAAHIVRIHQDGR